MKFLQMLPDLILWAVVAIRLIGLRAGWKPGILPAAVLVATGSTLNSDHIYAAVDEQLGGWNLLNLIVHLCLGLGLMELSRLLLRASRRPQHVKALIVLVGVLAVVQVVLLAVSDTQGSATNFTDTFGDQPTIALYQATFFAWVGIICGFTGVECLRRDRSIESNSFRLGFDILSAACLAGVLAVVSKMVLIGVEMTSGEAAYKDAFYLAYRLLIALTIIGFAVGFSLPCCGRIRDSLVEGKKRTKDLNQLRPIVRRLVETPEGKRSLEAAKVSLDARSSKTQLYRWLILIGDCRVLNPELLSPGEAAVVDGIGKEVDDAGSPSQSAMASAGV